MALTGIIQRRGLKTDLIGNPPITGEMVFATDTGEHGWLNETSTLVWKKFDEEIIALPNGGTIDQVLTKVDGTDGNAVWKDGGIFNEVVDYEKVITSSVGQQGPSGITLTITADIDGIAASVANWNYRLEVNFARTADSFSSGFIPMAFITHNGTFTYYTKYNETGMITSAILNSSTNINFNFSSPLMTILCDGSLNGQGDAGQYTATVRFVRLGGDADSINSFVTATTVDNLATYGGG